MPTPIEKNTATTIAFRSEGTGPKACATRTSTPRSGRASRPSSPGKSRRRCLRRSRRTPPPQSLSDRKTQARRPVLLVPQRLDRVEPRGLPRRVKAEEDAYADREEHRHHNRYPIGRHRPEGLCYSYLNASIGSSLAAFLAG